MRLSSTSSTKHAAASQAQNQAAAAATSFEKTIHFAQGQAIVWQIKFIVNQITSKKLMTQAANELEILSQKFGKEFDKYLLKELIEQIDLKDPVRAQKDKSEPFKVSLLNQELARCSQKPEFLLYFSEIAQQSFNDRVGDFLNELTKRLRLSFPNQLLVALSIVESSKEESQQEVIKILKQKLVDYHNYGRPEQLPEYAVHRILYLLATHPELKEDESLRDITQYIIDSSPLKPYTSHVSLRGALHQDLMFANTSQEEPSITLFKDGNGLDNLDKSYKMLEPWQILNDLGHFCSYNYNYLVKTLDDFKDINERTMARTLLNLSVNHTGYDDMTSRIVYNTFEANKKGDSSQLKKDVSDKKTQMNWSIDNLARAFRELYSNLNWQKVFEALSEIEDDITLDAKAFQTFLAIFNKSKPQNLQYPLGLILNLEWANPLLQINFIENSIQFYVDKKEKSILFAKTERRQELIEEITGIKDKMPMEVLNVWLSVDLVERLLILSDSHYFQKVRALFEHPMKTVPDYLLLTLSQAKPNSGNLMIDELLSLLLPQFLGNHINSIPVLQALWNNNKALMIRGICELCRHDQRIMNLSRVLDITQEVKESLIPIVNCEDYYFAVNLGILAGKRDFLHYDVWLQGRIQEVGTPFIKALNKYIKEHIIMPIIEFQKKHTNTQTGSLDMTPDQVEFNKMQILERSHLSREKLCITIEHLSNQQNRSNPKIKEETLDQIREVVTKIGEFFPSQVSQIQNSEEIDNAANEYFQKVFSADAAQVDQKILELIDTMQKFKESDVKKEQEIYACMLHSLFDEYRFLHRYPQQYLEKIAKLFGAIIKYRIIDGTLHDIALKFAYEAFRREGKRQKFGVITIKQFFDLLPQFPSFFEEIYEIRQNIQSTDPAMIKEIEELYEKTMKKNKDDEKREPASRAEEEKKNTESQRQDRRSTSAGIESTVANAPLTSINQEMFLSTFNNNARNTQAAASTTQQQPQVAEIPLAGSRSAQPQPSSQRPQAQQQQQPVVDHSQIIRNSTPSQSTTSQVFIPTYRQQQQQQQRQAEQAAVTQQQQQQQQQLTQQQQQPTQQQTPVIPQPSQTPGENTNLNVQSAAFKKQQPQANIVGQPQQVPTPQAQQIVGGGASQLVGGAGALLQPQINPISKPFRPNVIRSPAPNSQINQAVLQMQQQIDLKLQKALQENARIRIEDIIEDQNMQGPTPEVQEQIKFICNNTGKQNFQQKLEELKALIAQNTLANLNWFIHYVLTKRISAQSINLHPIYIDLIKQIGHKEATPLTIQQSVDIFKRCMLIDEELFLRIAQRPSPQASPIKQFLINLGAFLGGLTVANNRPLLAKELDIKQLLVEGFASEKLKYVVTFVCRIFKECSKSHIFKHQNPWIKANLEILREIYDSALSNNINNQQNEILMEIDALCKCLGINNINEINHSGFLKASQTQQYISQSQQVEVQHLMNKVQLIPAVQPAVVPQQVQFQSQAFPRLQAMSPSPMSAFANPLFQQPQRLMTPNTQQELSAMAQQNQQMEMQQMQQQMIQNQQEIYNKVCISQEIQQFFQRLAPQKEQVLRRMVADAVDSSITEILPPVVDRSVTIALITTRELVLKDFAFDGNFNKILKAADLIVQNLAGSLALVTCREPLKMSLTQNLKRSLQQLNQQLQTEEEATLSDVQINDMAQNASKENLELGCKLIKKSVIQKALTKVREDPQIMRAIEQRKASQAQNVPYYQDENLIAQFKDLPPQLKPNTNGLTDAQFQVYEDFDRLSNQPRKPSEIASTADVTSMSGSSVSGVPISGESSQSTWDIEAYLKQFERQQALDEVLEYQLGQKLKQIIIDQDFDEQSKLLSYCQKWMFTICERFNGQEQEMVNSLIEGLSFIVQKYRSERADDLQKKLCQQFMSFDSHIVSNLELTLTLMKKGIISIQHWDQMMTLYLRESQQFAVQEQFFGFIKEFIEQSVSKQKLFGYHQLPNLMAILEKISESPNVGKFFATILEDLKQKSTWNQETLREYFNEWAIMSFEESNPRQEQEVNRFFSNLQQMGLYKDSEIMYNFCKVMVEVSIERALFATDGTKRPQDRLDYRYIESFLKLMVVLLKTSDINKHEFMSKLFEAIHEVLDDDHKTKKSEFNQKPYYRLLINILTAVNNSQFFNPKTHLLILFSLADLFNKLNPNKYPAFSFAWLELVSHKQFMPHFLQAQPPSNPYPVQQPQRRGPTNQQQLSAQQQQQQQQQVPQDNTFFQKWFKFKELIVNLFTFLKNNMILGQKLSLPMVKYYEATLRTLMVIRHDYPEFLCDFHFNFVNSLPDHCIQLKNIILSAQPRSIPLYSPFSKNLKVDTLQEINNKPRMQSNYDNYLSLMNLREDLEKYFRTINSPTRNSSLIQVICEKMMQSEEIINGRRKINSSIINAVALFIGNYAVPQSKTQQTNQKECYEMFKKILLNLNPETRICLLNSLVNELRYINSYTYFYSWIIIFLFSDNDETIQEQITRILIERLQCHEPHPWGLCITFRELLQNPKYQFAKKSFVVQNSAVIESLLQTRLQPFYAFWQNQKQAIQQQQQHLQQHVPGGQFHQQQQQPNTGNAMHSMDPGQNQ